ncbi:MULTISPECIES: TetR/AcrR family transcriptional regulator [Marinobacter]|jgi:AcrR family transcriptional regulator|uniref:TetR/AcrR family transcriptional regulator n=3 Tax=Marinobacter TaxID=2742 RepID=A0A1E3CD53_9GAMM|nr:MULTISPECIES: TetR/AcrR family transcriptional regulator [Marinobacter]MBY6071435.1 TetR/AcrR family transcriptional regulator [Marinobacter salsuginis]MTI97889.1 TetR/AcrR family transcriptional regulator [Marinobacter adhaerens]ODM32880.1 TetR family transcriptional regulator [Marinobacter adhaerens]GBO83775.1 TetR family transcriptional regulator [Marinobacter salsuginis]|tara:strand:- start:2856 stop:3491 length:636 start_codon:yes stop_codon:yes gene_type:complete
MSEPLKTRREREKQARYDTILDAAELVFSEKGYERTSMDDIARTASLSRALLYVYFKDKAAIQRGIMLRAGHSLFRRFEEARQTADNGLAQIRAMGESYYRFYLEEPDYFSALTKASTAMAEADESQAEEMLCSKSDLMELMVGAIELGLQDGTMNRDRITDPVQTALYLRGALHGVILLCQSEMGEGNPEFPAEQLIRHTMDMLTSSISA